MFWIVIGSAFLLYGFYHLLRHLRLEKEAKRKEDEDYKDYKKFVDKNRL